MAAADACVHLAAPVGVGLVLERPLDSLVSALRGVDAVTGSASRAGVRLVLISSSEVYGGEPPDPVPEQAERVLGPVEAVRWNYALGKMVGEALAYGYRSERRSDTVTLRMFNCVGPRQDGRHGMVVPRFVRQALTGGPLTVCGDGRQARCFMHVLDATDAILRALDAMPTPCAIYNVGGTHAVTVEELARRVIARAGSSSEIRFVSRESVYGREVAEPRTRRPDVRAFRRDTGWRPGRSLDEAIDDVIREGLAAVATVPDAT